MVEAGVSVGEAEEKGRKRLRKERRRKEGAAAKVKASIVQDGTPSGVAPPSATTGAASTVLPSQPAASAKPPRKMAHRARFRASKRLASSDAAALSGILGVSQTAAITTPSEAASHTQSALGRTPAYSPSPAPPNQTHTSTTSVAAYFAAKIRARQLVHTTTTATPTAEESVPEADADAEPGTQDTLEGTTLVDGRKKNKKRKRRDVVENEQAATRDGGTAHTRRGRRGRRS